MGGDPARGSAGWLADLVRDRERKRELELVLVLVLCMRV